MPPEPDRPARVSTPPTPGEALAWLDAHVNLEKGVGVPAEGQRLLAIERIRPLLALLGSPELEYPAIHLTGTNGKTSTARLTTALLVAEGLSTGSYTSPHLERVNERLAWNAEPIDEVTLAEQLGAVARAEPFLRDTPSFFEILTAAALHWFGDIAVDVAVVEVGMGGKGDATNVVDSRVAVVTNVSIDHVEYLGPTLDDIATEKAGIVKPFSTLVVGDVDPELRDIFTSRNPERVVVRGTDYGIRSNRLAHGGRLLELYTPYADYRDLYLSLHGAHQADNAASAITAVECFLDAPLPADVVAEVCASASSPGRLEVVRHRPLVLLDGAHNVAGAHVLRIALDEEFPDTDRVYVVGLLRQKEPHEMLEALGATDAGAIVCCAPPSPRALAPDALAEAARDLGVPDARIEVVPDVERAVNTAIEVAGATGQVIVTGSLYTVGAARAALHAG
ncbi:MAG TPA: folylpolyglutamate synthase/dihydrofolate synthase family protein [Acidimicrobiia bacterium]|nr:folylpolyglutamate synthase/dihydrofolate synthase family protein [Acidimicrobiia bacterium]